jgi:hypothetical protein
MLLKKYSLLLIAALCFTTGTTAQNNCSTYFPFKAKTVLGYSYFDKKDKLTGKSVHTVEKITNNQDGSLSADIQIQHQDKKGNEISSASYEVFCINNILSMDITEVMAPNMKASLENMEVDISGDAFELPSNLKEGQELPDLHTEIKAGTNGITIITMAIDHTNRVVESKEKVTTEAGTFQCVKLTYDVGLNMLISKNYRIVSWYSQDLGLIKQETYNKRGQLESKTELTGIKKGK